MLVTIGAERVRRYADVDYALKLGLEGVGGGATYPNCWFVWISKCPSFGRAAKGHVSILHLKDLSSA